MNYEVNYNPFPVYSMLSVRNLYTIFHQTFPKGFSFPGESHNFWELNYIIAGSAGATSEDSIYNCQPGDIFLHAPNQYHRFWLTEEQDCEVFTISFDGSGLEDQLAPGKYTLTDDDKYSISRILHELSRLFDEYHTTAFSQLFDLSASNNIGYQMIKNCLELLCLSLIRHASQLRGLPATDANSLCYARTTAFLRDHVEKNLTMEMICQGVYESPCKIKEVFHHFTGGGVIHFYNQLRCEHIMRLLLAGMSVKNIAAAMNFSSPYYLSYFFKRETGMTPLEYKKQAKK